MATEARLVTRWVSGYAALYDDPHWVSPRERAGGTTDGGFFECYARGAFYRDQLHATVELFDEHDRQVGLTVELFDDEIGLRFVGYLDAGWTPPSELAGVSLRFVQPSAAAMTWWTSGGQRGRRLEDVTIRHIGLVARPVHRGTAAVVSDRPIADGVELRRALIRRWPFAADRITGGPPSEIHHLTSTGARRG